MSNRIPDPASGFEEEGVPDMGYTLPGKEITGDPQEGFEPPHDVAMAADDYGTTVAEQVAGEPHDLRISREQPDVLADVDKPFDESEGVDTPFSEHAGTRAGRLVDPDEGVRTDTEAALVAHDAGTDLGGFSAEEAAIHIEPGV